MLSLEPCAQAVDSAAPAEAKPALPYRPRSSRPEAHRADASEVSNVLSCRRVQCLGALIARAMPVTFGRWYVGYGGRLNRSVSHRDVRGLGCWFGVIELTGRRKRG